MTGDPEPPLGDAEQALAQRLAADRPQPSPALRRRVRGRVDVALGRRALRVRAVSLTVCGLVLLAGAAALALSVPG